jgi:asparagine synthase (glutamine-hydrolysing)
MSARDRAQGLLVLSLRPRAEAPDPTAALRRVAGGPVDSLVVSGRLALHAWGEDRALPAEGRAAVLAADPRVGDRAVGPEELHARLLAHDTGLLTALQPTAAVVALREDRAVLAACDPLGFRHLYLVETPTWSGLSTSARVLGALAGGGLDQDALGVQCLLGWQLRDRTLFAGVRKVPGRTVVELLDGRAVLRSYEAGTGGRVSLDDAVDEAAAVLRGNLAAYLDDHADPDAGIGLQLTGGQDSRILLSAIAPERRREVRAVTLAVPDSPDLAIAAAIARDAGLEHEVLSLAGADGLAPEDAHARCRRAAAALELGADPVARAALGIAEERSRPGPRLSGLGGEVARGFYYLGGSSAAPVTHERTRRLVAWRMGVNEAVGQGALDPGFRAWAVDRLTRDVHEILSGSGQGWLAATDTLYLDHRMQRWAGVTETAGCTERAVANPMLDARFIDLAERLAPEDKRGSRFLGRLQMALDDGLGRVPLDERPAPLAYAHPGVLGRGRRALSVARKVESKVRQRVSGARRAPAGGDLVASAVVRHWRAHPTALDAAAETGLFREAWLDGVRRGSVEPAPADVSILVNLEAASVATAGLSLSRGEPLWLTG